MTPARQIEASSSPAEGKSKRRRGKVSPIDIILLGLLKEQPRNGYEINKVIKQRRIRSWVRISEASVYRKLRSLADAGALSSRTTRDGQNPEKTVFALTPAGIELLAESIAAAARQPVNLHFDFDVWLSHLGHVPPQERAECLASLRERLVESREEARTMIEEHHIELPAEVGSLMDLRWRVLSVVCQWLDEISPNEVSPAASHEAVAPEQEPVGG